MLRNVSFAPRCNESTSQYTGGVYRWRYDRLRNGALLKELLVRVTYSPGRMHINERVFACDAAHCVNTAKITAPS